MTSLLQVPSTILIECIKYLLTEKSVLYFLNANKSVLYKIKQEISFFRLSVAESIQYYKTKKLPKKISHLITDKSKQIGLSFLSYSQDDKEKVIFDFSRVNDVRSIRLEGDYSILCGTEDLGSIVGLQFHFDRNHLSSFPDSFRNLRCFKSVGGCRIKDLSPLVNIPDIIMQRNPYIRSTYPLSSLTQRSVDFTRCWMLKDVSSLGGIPSVILENCKFLKDIKGLGNHDYLNLSSYISLKDISSLHDVKHLNISYTNISNIPSKTRVQSLDIIRCRALKSLEALKDLRRIWLTEFSIQKLLRFYYQDKNSLPHLKIGCILSFDKFEQSYWRTLLIARSTDTNSLIRCYPQSASSYISFAAAEKSGERMMTQCVKNHYDNDVEPSEMVGGNDLFAYYLQGNPDPMFEFVMAQTDQINEFQEKDEIGKEFSDKEIEKIATDLIINDEAIFKKMKSYPVDNFTSIEKKKVDTPPLKFYTKFSYGLQYF
jgi:hypothetical protein